MGSASKRVRARGTGPESIRGRGMHRCEVYKWKSKYGGLAASDLKRLKELEAENRKLKQMYAEAELQNRVLKDVIEKKL